MARNIVLAVLMPAAMACLPGCSRSSAEDVPGIDQRVSISDERVDTGISVLADGDCQVSIHNVSGFAVPIDSRAFVGCEAESMASFLSTLTSALDRYDQAGIKGVPQRRVITLSERYSRNYTERVRDSGSEAVPIIMLPSPRRVRSSLARAWAGEGGTAPTIGELMGANPLSAVTLFYPPRDQGPRANSTWIPTPRGHPFPLPGVLKYGQPWNAMGRLVVCEFSGGGVEVVMARLDDTLDKLDLNPDAALWSIPVNSVASLITYATRDEIRSWVAYAVADAVAGRRSDGGGFAPGGESVYSVPFESPRHEPRGVRNYPLLRIPAANQRGDRGTIPGERIALDEWFADPVRGFAALVHAAESRPGLPVYTITPDANVLAGPGREMIEAVYLFETISADRLDKIVRAYLGIQN